MSRAAALGLPLLTLLWACASGTPLEQRAWIEVRSPNFAILTNLPEPEAVALSGELELFRAVVRKVTNAKHFDPRVPTRIVAFAGSHEFRPFAPPNALGYFVPGLRENYVALDASNRNVGAKRVLFHEYTHFLVQNQNEIALPLWYNEGFAEFMSTLQIQESSVFIGAAPMDRSSWARYGQRMPTSRLIRTRAYYRLTPNDQGMFYLQAWQLVHYFMLGPGKNVGSVGTRMARYVRALEQGEGEAPAFEAAFGMSLAELDRELLAYGRLDAIPAVAPKRSAFVPDAGHEVRQVPPAQAALQLGILAQSVGLLPLSESYFRRALAADPTLALAQVGAGASRLFAGDSAGAEPYFDRALELAPDDYEVQIDFGHYLLLRAQREERLDLVPSARKHLQRGIELAPEVPEGHALLGRTYVLTEEDPQPGIASLERARALLPGNIEIQLPLAQLYLRAGRRDDARAVAQRVARWSHGDVGAQAKSLLDELGELEPAAE